MMTTYKQRVVYVLMWCFFCTALALGLMEANSIARFSGASLRFYVPITGQAAYRARQYSAANPEAFWPTFWHHDRITLSNGINTVDASSILFSGDAALVWPAEYIVGSAPSSIDGAGIVVSQAIAHRLFGSTDIVGMSVYANNQPRFVRGVFNSSAEMVLIPFHIEDTSQYWTAVELSGGVPSPARNDAKSFAALSGIGRPDYVIMGGAMAASRFMAVFPLFIPVVYVVALFVRFIRRYYAAAGVPILFAGLILFAIALPILLNGLPPWLIPTHWSDFTFWSSLSTQATDALREFLSAPSMMRDVELKIHLLRQAGFMVVAICFGIVVCFIEPTS